VSVGREVERKIDGISHWSFDEESATMNARPYRYS